MPMLHSKRFLIKQFAEFSYVFGKVREEQGSPIFDFDSGGFNLHDAKNMKKDIRVFLYGYYTDLDGKQVSEENHKKRLRSLSTTITRRYKHMLHKRRYRLGVAQKIVNTFLKLLWSAGLIDTPHHCPFDNMVRRKIERFVKDGWLEDWSEFTSMKEYEKYVSAARIAASKERLSIADWDIKYFC